ncbi:MAG: membrane protein insertase YidC [Methylobacteriaceae bacterium]|nr:membrane protein insertase YidC [Methylobacteriaceae bacterium]
MTQENKNLILAMGLSVLVLIGWNYFYGQPQLDRARQAQQAQTQPGAAPTPGATSTPGAGAPPAPQAGQPGAAPAAPGAAAPVVQRSRADALAAGPRLAIDTPSLSGSINLTGGRIDDVSLKGYRETIDARSPTIVLLSPAGAPNGYWAEIGVAPAQGTTAALPTPQTVWTADSDKLTPQKPVTLTWDNGQGVIFRRAVSVDERYMFTVKDTIENRSQAALALHPYALIAREGKPKTDGYAVLHEGLLGVIGESAVQEYTYDGIEKEPNRAKTWKGEGGWVGITDKYWGTAVVPEQSRKVDARFLAYGQNQRTYQADMLGEAQTIAPGASLEVTNRVFAGAKETAAIDAYAEKFGIKNFDRMIDWGWFYFITKPLFKLIDLIYRWIGNFGVAILIVTLLVKIAFFPLANRSYESMAKMKAVQPEMQAIRERYAEDKQRQQQELMELYKREKINPVAGCLPIMLQIPVFFALYKVIFITIEMRHAPFYGWIRDLSAADPTNIFNLFGLLSFDPTQIPVFGSFLHLGIWPLLMGVTMFVQMKMNPEPTDPVQKTMFAWMPVIFTFLLGTFPAGLVIYWTWNNILSVLQQGYIMRKNGVKVELWDNLAKMFRKSDAPAKS